MTLDEITLKRGNLKGSQHHNYMVEYEKYFAPIRETTRLVLEIGIEQGQSLQIWREYFPNAVVCGIDHAEICKRYEGERTRVFIGEQQDEVFLKAMCDQVEGQFDIIIDDGSHVLAQYIRSLRALSPKLKPGGYYFIEDINAGWLPYCKEELDKVLHDDPTLELIGIYCGGRNESLAMLRKREQR